MAKTIKFNLILDGKPVRDIEGLQENFSIDDILLVYKNGLLEKWLKVRGFEDYLKKVEKINKNKETLDKMKNPEENVQNTPENNEDNKTDYKGEYLDDLDNAVNELDAFVKSNKKIQEANKKKVKKEEDIEEIVLEETMFDEINSKYDLDIGE